MATIRGFPTNNKHKIVTSYILIMPPESVQKCHRTITTFTTVRQYGTTVLAQ